MSENESKDEAPTEKQAEESRARPPAELHNPFGKFAFDPTDGGEF